MLLGSVPTVLACLYYSGNPRSNNPEIPTGIHIPCFPEKFYWFDNSDYLFKIVCSLEWFPFFQVHILSTIFCSPLKMLCKVHRAKLLLIVNFPLLFWWSWASTESLWITVITPLCARHRCFSKSIPCLLYCLWLKPEFINYTSQKPLSTGF